MEDNFDEFDDPNFNPEEYINKKFPDEYSLQNLDEEINNVKSNIFSLDKEILNNIHNHSLLNNQVKVELNNTKNLTEELINEIKVI